MTDGLGSTDYNNQIQEAVAQVEKPQTNTLTFSTGVVLKTKQVPVMRLQSIIEKFKYPEVPLINNPSKGRAERNPEHPVYLEQRAEVDTQRALAIVDAVIVFGTEIEHVPDSVPSLESKDWIEELDLVGIDVKSESRLARYLAWVKYVAMVTQDDLLLIRNQAGLTMGVSEEQIAQQMRDNFPDNETR